MVIGVLHRVIIVIREACGPGKMSIRSLIGPMRVLHAPTEEYINWEHTKVAHVVCCHVRLVADQVVCVRKPHFTGRHMQLLVLSVDRSLSPLGEQMNV